MIPWSSAFNFGESSASNSVQYGVLQVIRSAAAPLDQALTQRIDSAKIGAHAFEHDLAINVNHGTCRSCDC
jgi:hypothetical protein